MSCGQVNESQQVKHCKNNFNWRLLKSFIDKYHDIDLKNYTTQDMNAHTMESNEVIIDLLSLLLLLYWNIFEKH